MITPKEILARRAARWVQLEAEERQLSPLKFAVIAHTDVGFRLMEQAPADIGAEVREHLRKLYDEHRQAMHRKITDEWAWLRDPAEVRARCMQEKHGERIAELEKKRKQYLSRITQLKRQLAQAEKRQAGLALWQVGEKKKAEVEIAEIHKKGKEAAARLAEIKDNLQGLDVSDYALEQFVEAAKQREAGEHKQLDERVDTQIRRADPAVRRQEKDEKEQARAAAAAQEKWERDMEEKRARDEARAAEERQRQAQERRAATAGKRSSSGPRPS